MKDQKINKIAIQRDEARFGFYMHLMIYLIVNTVLAGGNLVIYPQFLYFVFPLVGWSIAILIHGYFVFAVRKRNLKEK